MGKVGFLEKRILGKESGLSNGKLAPQSQPHQPPKCPECASHRIWKDGLRYVKTDTGEMPTQRYLCRNCGYRFSRNGSTHRSEPLKNPSRWSINNASAYTLDRQVCEFLTEGSKNLIGVESRLEKAAGATLDIKGALVNYEAKMVLQGKKPKTILTRLSVLRLLIKRSVNLLNPIDVFKAIDHTKRYNHATRELQNEEWMDGSKANAAQAYKTFCEITGIQIPKDVNFDKWSKRSSKLPWIPLEKEIDALIAGSSRKIATFLQLLKETWCRSGEAWRLEWVDVDIEHNVVTINRPEKNGLPRQFKVSSKLTAMVNTLPKTNNRVFAASTLTKIRQNFIMQRARISYKLQNPRIKRITFHTLRHWGATMEYHRTKDILHVKERLGHRSITSTLVYTHLVNFEGDEYHTATSKSLKEDEELLKAGFEYVTERDGIKIYRKRK